MRDEDLGLLLGLVVAGLIILLIDLGMFVAWALRKDDVDAGRRPPIFAQRWSLVDVWFGGQIVVALTLGAAIPLFLFALFIAGPKGVSFTHPAAGPVVPLLLALTAVIQNGLSIGVSAGFIVWKYKLTIGSIGLKWPPTRRELRTGALSGLLMLVAAMVLEGGLRAAIRLVFGPAALHHLEELTSRLTMEGVMGHGMTGPMFVALFITGAIAAPLGEEFFFRGFLYNSAKARFGVKWGIAISAAIFALVHLGPLAVVPILFMGAFLAYMYERTGSLWVTITMHSVTNGVQILAAYSIPGS